MSSSNSIHPSALNFFGLGFIFGSIASLHFAGWRRSMMNLVGPDSASSFALTFLPPPTHKPLPGSVLASPKDVGLVTLRSVSAQPATQGWSPIGLLTTTYCDIDLLQLPFPRHQLVSIPKSLHYFKAAFVSSHDPMSMGSCNKLIYFLSSNEHSVVCICTYSLTLLAYIFLVYFS